jgi:hypothetical protein
MLRQPMAVHAIYIHVPVFQTKLCFSTCRKIGTVRLTLEMPAEGYEHQNETNEREGAEELVRVRHIYCLPSLFAENGSKKGRSQRIRQTGLRAIEIGRRGQERNLVTFWQVESGICTIRVVETSKCLMAKSSELLVARELGDRNAEIDVRKDALQGGQEEYKKIFRSTI